MGEAAKRGDHATAAKLRQVAERRYREATGSYNDVQQLTPCEEMRYAAQRHQEGASGQQQQQQQVVTRTERSGGGSPLSRGGSHSSIEEKERCVCAACVVS